MSAYRVAIDQTTRTIDMRARSYRNLVVIIVLTSLLSFVSAIITHKISLLSSLLFLVPICGLFFFLDQKLLNRWQSDLLRPWVKKEIDLMALRPALEALPKIPKETLHSMLATLPTVPDLLTEQRISPGEREAIAATIHSVSRRRMHTLAAKTAAAAIISTALVSCISLRTWNTSTSLQVQKHPTAIGESVRPQQSPEFQQGTTVAVKEKHQHGRL